MATAQEVYTTTQAAEILQMTDTRVRQLCISHENIGKKHGHVWMLTEADIVRIQNLPDLRRKSAG